MVPTGIRPNPAELARTLLVPAVYPVAVVLGHAILSRGFDAYDRIAWIDIPVHMLGGAAIGYFFSAVLLGLDRMGLIRASDAMIHALLVLGLVALAAIGWEFLEFIYDRLLGTNVQRSVSNVMRDQFTGLAGGFCLVLVRTPSLMKKGKS